MGYFIGFLYPNIHVYNFFLLYTLSYVILVKSGFALISGQAPVEISINTIYIFRNVSVGISIMSALFYGSRRRRRLF